MTPMPDPDPLFDRPNDFVIFAYPREQAIADGVLHPIFSRRWHDLSGGMPIIATTNVVTHFSEAAMIEIWNTYVHWVKKIAPTLDEEDRLFQTTMNGHRVWVIEDGSAVTMMFPEDY
jgi:hypothetical protein